MMDVCDIVIETPEMHSRPEVARYIEQEVARPSKTWIHAVLEGRQEKDDVVHDSRDFLLLPDTERRQWPERSLNWLGIVKDRSIRSLRDLRGKEHLEMLRTMLDECMAAIERKTFIPRSRVMAYVHYPPSVYQLHVHFVSPYTLHKDPYRVHSLESIISNLTIDPYYYAKSSIPVAISRQSLLYFALTGTRPEHAYQTVIRSVTPLKKEFKPAPRPFYKCRGSEPASKENMSAAKKAVAFPCAVYVRTRGTSFLFSHMCDPGFIKEFPLSLTVSSIRDFVARRQRSMLRAPFVILVTGDTGRLVTSQGPGGPFLYTGSRYCTPLPYTQTEEVESDHIYMKFHATLATYVRGRLTDCAAIESGLMVIPRQMQAGDFSRLCRWAQRQVEKSIKDSTFLTEDASYNEQSLRAKHSPPEAQATPKKPVEKINGL